MPVGRIGVCCGTRARYVCHPSANRRRQMGVGERMKAPTLDTMLQRTYRAHRTYIYTYIQTDIHTCSYISPTDHSSPPPRQTHFASSENHQSSCQEVQSPQGSQNLPHWLCVLLLLYRFLPPLAIDPWRELTHSHSRLHSQSQIHHPALLPARCWVWSVWGYSDLRRTFDIAYSGIITAILAGISNQFSSITFLSTFPPCPVANKIKASSPHRTLLPSTLNAQHLHQEGVDRVKCFSCTFPLFMLPLRYECESKDHQKCVLIA